MVNVNTIIESVSRVIEIGDWKKPQI